MVGELLDIYQKIYQQGEVISQNTGEEGKLQLSGLVVKRNNHLQVYNPIYREVFNQQWIDNQLAALRPYSEAFRAWYNSGCQDSSWLLRGNALKTAEVWAESKNVSFQDKQFLAASRKQEIEEEIIEKEKEAELKRERKEKEAAERTRIIEEEARKKAEKQLKTGGLVLSISVVFAVVFGITAFIAKQNIEKMEQNVSKIRELSAVASQLQQTGQNNEANQFSNIAGLVLQDKIKNQELKEALLDSSLVSGYESLKTEEKKNTELESQYNKAKEDLNKSFEKLPKENNFDKNDSSYLATLVYIYYVKGKLGKSLNNYKIASDKYNLLKSQLKSSNTNLFKLDLNILYNGNADIVASLYRQLNDLDKSNTVYYESLKTHLLNELDYLMKENRWKDAALKHDQFLFISAKKEKELSLRDYDIKNFQCKDLKEVDKLWVTNSKGKFGYSVQKRIYLETGNSLDFDWEKGSIFHTTEYKSFAKRVGWDRNGVTFRIKVGGEWKSYGEVVLDERMDSFVNGSLPIDYGSTFLVRFVECSRSGFL
jgi:hypothetical protein